MIKKLTLLILLVSFISVPAFAGNIPEFDAVGDDSANFFNDFVQAMVVDNNKDYADVLINQDSAFWNEYFDTAAAGPFPSACFPGYLDYKAGPFAPTYFEWNIVLQMMPETDLDLLIRDCVLKENTRDIWFYAQQTGRWRQTNSRLVFAKNKNPRVSVMVSPGPRQPAGYAPFYMDARRMPGLGLTTLYNKLYTSKALWEETIVMKMPEPGQFNQIGEPTFVLREGDVMNVKVDVPWNNPVDIYYGPDNAVIQYVGIIGMSVTASDLPEPEED